jgi:hypothetical protein
MHPIPQLGNLTTNTIAMLEIFRLAADDFVLPDITNIAGDRPQRQAFHITNIGNIKTIACQWKYGLCFRALAKAWLLSHKAS